MKLRNTLAACATMVVVVATPAFAAKTLIKNNALASYYGAQYHGRPTSSGETFDMYGMSAAHRSLPFGTMLEVTNLENGKSAVVRVNDRGPFVEGREIDVSLGAAEKLGMTASGVARVSISIVDGADANPKGSVQSQPLAVGQYAADIPVQIVQALTAQPATVAPAPVTQSAPPQAPANPLSLLPAYPQPPVAPEATTATPASEEVAPSSGSGAAYPSRTESQPAAPAYPYGSSTPATSAYPYGSSTPTTPAYPYGSTTPTTPATSAYPYGSSTPTTPATSASPYGSSTPATSAYPYGSTTPDATAYPYGSTTPDATAYPYGSTTPTTPATSAYPYGTTPDSTAYPYGSSTPDATAYPYGTATPDATAYPYGTTPDSTAYPYGTATPDATAYPYGTTPDSAAYPYGDAAPAADDDPDAPVWRLQLGAFIREENAIRLVRQIRAAGIEPAYERTNEAIRVVIAGVKDADLESVKSALEGAGLYDYVLRRER